MRLAACPVPVSSNSDSLTTPPSVGSLPVITTRASGHDVGLAARTRPVVPPWRTPLGDAIGRPADARAPIGSGPRGAMGTSGGVQPLPLRQHRVPGVPGGLDARLEDPEPLERAPAQQRDPGSGRTGPAAPREENGAGQSRGRQQLGGAPAAGHGSVLVDLPNQAHP